MCPKFNYWSGWFTSKPCRLGFFLLCFLLRATVNAQTVTNVDFVIVSGLQDIPGSGGVPDLSIWNKYPSGRILFWTVLFDENQERGSVYRSESGHIGFMQVIDGTEYFLIADSNGSPCRWLLEPHFISGSCTWMGETRSVSSFVPAVWAKTYFDIFGTQGNNVLGRLFKNGEGIVETSTYVGVCLSDAVGSCSFKWRKYSMGNFDYYGIVPGIWGEAVNSGKWEPWWYQGCNHYYSLHAVWRANYFDVDLEFFRGLLDSQWWLTGKYAVHWNHGITGIGHGSGEQGMSGSPAPSGGGGIISVPGDDILNPPTTPLGANGKWVYDPEKRVWQWQGDIADNVDKINPYDNSVMPENSLSIEGKWATESTLRRVLQTLEGFQKQQGITPEQLQVMIDSGVVSIVDGMVQYWEGKHLPEVISSVGDKVDSAAQSISSSSSSAANQVSGAVSAGADKIYNELRRDYSGLVGQLGANRASINQVWQSVDAGASAIVDAINGLDAPSIDVPTTEGQIEEEIELPSADLVGLSARLDQICDTLGFPSVSVPIIPPGALFSDWPVGVFDWRIPFSEFMSDSRVVGIIQGARTIILWLLSFTALLGLIRSMGGGA